MKVGDDRFPPLLGFVSVASLVLLMFSAAGMAQWVDNGVTVCGNSFDQGRVVLSSDGAGGAFVAWRDERISGNAQAFIQSIDESGIVQWVTDGIQLCPLGFQQDHPKVLYDNSGGAVVLWVDNRNGYQELYAQRIDATGATVWAATSGVLVGSPVNILYYYDYSAALTNNGYVFVLFTASDGSFRIQCLELSTGSVYGPVAGIEVSPSSVHLPRMAVDQHDEAIIAMGLGADSDAYAARYDHNLSPVWTPANKLLLEMDSGNSVDILAVGADTCVVACTGFRSGHAGIWALSIDYAGNILWGESGNLIGEDFSGGNVSYPKIVPGSAGGTVVLYRMGVGSGRHIVAQGVSAIGACLWGDGVLVGEHGYPSEYPEAIPDGTGGAIVLLRNEQIDIQRLDYEGNRVWSPTGHPVLRNEMTDVTAMPRLVVDGSGGALVAWGTEQVVSEADAFVQRISSDGFWTDPEAPILAVPDVPDDEGGYVMVILQASGYDQAGVATFPITGYNLWRQTQDQAMGSIGEGLDAGQVWERICSGTDSGTVLSQDQAAALGFPPGSWESLGFHTATQQPTYDLVAPTFRDSTYLDSGWATYLVTAHTPDPSVYFVSDPDSGYSVDNLAPAMPLVFQGVQQSNPDGLRLTWLANTEPDLGWYSIYRGLNADFEPDPANLLQNTMETSAFDPEWNPGSVFYYKLTAVDRHGNQSDTALLTPLDVVGGYLSAYNCGLAAGCAEINWSVAQRLAEVVFAVYRAEPGADSHCLVAEIDGATETAFTYKDCDCRPGSQYSYRVEYGREGDMRLLFETDELEIPALRLALEQNYPNPFNPKTTILYQLPASGRVRLAVYDVAGRLVTVLVDGSLEAGRHEENWDGKDAEGKAMPAGAYFSRLEGDFACQTMKMLLVR